MRQKPDGMKITRLGHACPLVKTGDARIQVIWTVLRLHGARTKGDDHGYTVSDP